MTIEPRMDEQRDQFPVGMRVLAVDDDPTCLRLLETLLRRCRYHVTSTNQALTALKLLRENKDKFDLVISDVHMPDMDGFKLLELVGLEMDLPVIMLSANGDTKLVMQGVTHGACDYLVKPVRIEELKNIWQHVVRRTKFVPKDRSGDGNQDTHQVSRLGGQGSGGTGNADPNVKAIKRRKDQNEDEDDEQESEHDNEETTTQKKPRVVWSVELHHKFVAAVRQLGIDKAVPKKILDLMNVEKLTRENVASHLQKYRLYLKRISCQQNQQANMVAALGGADPSYLQIGCMNGLAPLQHMAGSGQFQNSISGPFSPVGMLGRLSTPSSLGMHGLSSPGLVPLGHSQNSNLMSDQIKFQQALLPANLDGSMIQGTPMPLELDQLHQSGSVSSFDNLHLSVNNKAVSSNRIPVSKGTINSSNPLLGITNNALVLEPQEAVGGKTYENPTALVGSLHSEFSTPMLDPGRCNERWSSAVQSSTSSDCFRPGTMHSQDNLSSAPFPTGNLQFQDSTRDMNYQGTSAQHILTNLPKQEWEDHRGDIPYNSNVMYRFMNAGASANGAVYQLDQNADPKNTSFNIMNSSNLHQSLHMDSDYVRRSFSETKMKLNLGYNMDQYKAQHSCSSSNSESLEDLVTAMMKQEQDKVIPVGEDFGCDLYSIGSCI